MLKASYLVQVVEYTTTSTYRLQYFSTGFAYFMRQHESFPCKFRCRSQMNNHSFERNFFLCALLL